MRTNFKIEHYGRDKKKWLKNRGYGGSSISALFGCNPYMTMLDIYCSAVNKNNQKKDKQTKSTQYGKNVEQLMANLFALNYPQYKVEYPKDIVMYRRIDKPFMTYTPDGLLVEKETNRKGILEIKSHTIANKEDANEWANGKLPQNYYLQVLQGLAVITNREFVELYAILNFLDYDNGTIHHSEIRHYHLERNDRLGDIALVEKVQTDFEINHIQKRVPPDIEIKF